ncbi:MAG: hypothetical protein PSX37_02360 [bacterium]|nr:hypothetical protein [bacterium]
MDSTQQPILLIGDIADLFRVSKSQAYVYVAQPGFPSALFGHRRNRKWPTSTVMAYINDPHDESTPTAAPRTARTDRDDVRNATITVREPREPRGPRGPRRASA